jgi:site-specific recombinase XerD
MIDAMVLRGFSPRTQESYADAIYGMAKHYRRDPAQYTAREVEAYLLYMVQERHLSYSTMNQAACAARFLYEKVLGRERELFSIAMAKVPAKQPELLAREEIARLFACCSHPAYRMALQTIYATGLRVSEACALRVADIDSASDRMCVRVNAGKGSADRYSHGANSWPVCRQPEMDGSSRRHAGLQFGAAHLDAGFAPPHSSACGDGLRGAGQRRRRW